MKMTEKQKDALTLIGSLPEKLQEQFNSFVESTINQAYIQTKNSNPGEAEITLNMNLWFEVGDDMVYQVNISCLFKFDKQETDTEIISIDTLSMDEWLDVINQVKQKQVEGSVLEIKNG